MPQAGICLRNTLSALNPRYRMELQTQPEALVEWIIRGDGDSVDSLMRSYPQAFTKFEVVDQAYFKGEGGFAIYRLRKR